jgi:NAD(P)-dependent dehydrogenase (short-subunit alcohol dehydrogenase family)
MRPIDEQTILITGATDGLGLALAIELAGQGATLLLHGRDDARGEAAIAEILDRAGGKRPRWYRADLASLDEVRGMSERIVESEPRLDALVNNAGIGTTLPGDGERMTSADGHELRFAVNYLAPFLLSRSLVPLLRSSAPARIVNVASAGQAPIDFDDVMLERGYSGTRAYCQSKLALVMLTLDLAEELAADGITANTLHPGTYMPTKMVRHAGRTPVTPLTEGVQATARLVSAAALDGVTGRYFDGTEEATALAQAYDAAARSRLRALSEELV